MGKRRKVILAMLLVTGIGLLSPLKSLISKSGESTGSEDSQAVVRKLRENHFHGSDQYKDIEPRLVAIIRQLESASEDWHAANPSLGLQDEAKRWRNFSVAEVSKLETEDLRALIDLIEERDLGLWGHIQAMYRVWGSREPEVARAMIIKKAADHGLLSDSAENRSSSMSDYIFDFYHQTISGIAITDPTLAYQTFLQDLANPEVEKLVDDSTTVPDIFATFAASDPNEAWNAVLDTASKDHFLWKLNGYLNGVEIAQDWDGLTNDIFKFASKHQIEFDEWHYEDLAGRWFRDDAEAALKWFSKHAPPEMFLKEEVGDPTDPFGFETRPLPIDHLPPSEIGERLESELIRAIFGKEDQATIRYLSGQSASGSYQQTQDLLTEMTDSAMTIQKAGYLEVLPSIEDFAVREELFLRFVHAIHPRGEKDADPFAMPSADLSSFEEPNRALEAVREFSGSLDLSPETLTEAKAHFAGLIEQEKLNRARIEEEARNPDPDDPFAP